MFNCALLLSYEKKNILKGMKSGKQIFLPNDIYSFTISHNDNIDKYLKCLKCKNCYPNCITIGIWKTLICLQVVTGTTWYAKYLWFSLLLQYSYNYCWATIYCNEMSLVLFCWQKNKENWDDVSYSNSQTLLIGTVNYLWVSRRNTNCTWSFNYVRISEMWCYASISLSPIYRLFCKGCVWGKSV